MAYDVYLGNMLLPIAPGKLALKINNQNKTMNLINEGEINILKNAGLTDIDFEVLLPNVPYPFAIYKNGFEKAKVFIDKLENLKTSKKPFQFIVTRRFPNGKMIFDTNMTVSLEDYSINEDAKSAFDFTAKISLKQYRHYSTKICNVTFTNSQPTVSTISKREETNSPAPKEKGESHKVVKGDSLYSIACKYYGNGNRYPDIYDANQSIIDKGNSGTGNPRYTIYPNQVFTIPV